jgi:hypothetical protein
MQPADHLGLAFHQGIFGDVEAERFETGTDLEQILDQKTLGTADVENAIARLEPEVFHHVLGNRNPAAVVAVAAVAVGARPVEIELAVFARDGDDLVRLGFDARADIAFAARQFRQQVQFFHCGAPACSRAARSRPSRSGV